jgi:hypothetical protein
MQFTDLSVLNKSCLYSRQPLLMSMTAKIRLCALADMAPGRGQGRSPALWIGF